jgi:putative ABC transport system substrate-binding protein
MLLSAFLGTATAQPRGEVPRVGYLVLGSHDPIRQRYLEAFRQGLRELGYVEGQNIALEPRWAEGKHDRLPALAADLVHSKVDVIVAMSGAATQAAQQATRTIPIVMSLVADPVGSGLVASLARPGGTVTGLTIMAPDLAGKQLHLLKEVVPGLSLVALLTNPDNPASAPFLREAEATARAPKLYETHLVPLIFEPYAADLANRLASRSLARVLEIAAGTGVVTRSLAAVLPEHVSIVATDLNQPMLDLASTIGTNRPVEWRQADVRQMPGSYLSRTERLTPSSASSE